MSFEQQVSKAYRSVPTVREEIKMKEDKQNRIFRTEIYTPSDEFKKNIGETVCQLIHPYVFELIDMKHEDGIRYILTCKVTGKPTDLAQEIFLKENKKK